MVGIVFGKVVTKTSFYTLSKDRRARVEISICNLKFVIQKTRFELTDLLQA